MPGLDGFATLAVLKRAHPDIKVVMMTGTRDVRIEDRARAEGATDFLYKPFFAKDIDAVLNRLFGLATLMIGVVVGDYWRTISTVNSPLRMRLDRLSAYVAAASSP